MEQSVPLFEEVADTAIRLGVATLAGALVGIEREVHGRWAGLRTHIMVALGAAVFVVAGLEISKPADGSGGGVASAADVTRVVQGIAAGIGFLGAGTILKLGEQLEIKGLTTASSIWLAAALGTAAGLGEYPLAIAGTAISLVVLAVLRPLEKLIERRRRS